jgi:hypothetical protein
MFSQPNWEDGVGLRSGLKHFDSMKRIDRRLMMVVGALSLVTGVQGSIYADDSRENEYKLIADRNPFGLKPLPPPQTNAPVQAQQPKSDIKLTGITSFGTRKAYFKISEVKGKEDFYTLGEGEAKDGLEVLNIDDVGKSVRIRNAGVETLMTFASHGITAAAGAPPPNPGMPAGAPGFVPNQLPPNTTAYNMSVTPGAAPSANPITVAPIKSIPSRTLPVQPNNNMPPELAARYGFPPGQATTVNQYQQPGLTVHATENRQNLSSEEQVLLLELQRVANQKSNPRAIMPPTPGLPGQ